MLDECELSENVKKVLLDNIQLKLTQQAVKIRADIEVACYTYEGIDAVKDALRAGIACSTDVVPIKINLIAPPLYVITTSTPEKAVSITAIINVMQDNIFYLRVWSLMSQLFHIGWVKIIRRRMHSSRGKYYKSWWVV